MTKTYLVCTDDSVKVQRFIGIELYSIEFDKDVKAKDLVEYWEINDDLFKRLGKKRS